MGLSITTPVGVAAGGGVSLLGAEAAAGGAGPPNGRRGGGGGGGAGGGREGRGGRLGPAPTEPDLGFPLDEIDRRQVVPLHQPDEVSDRADVEGLVGPRRVLRHTSYTPTQATRTVSSDFGTWERTSQPSGVTSTSSSIRIPPQSGK